MSWSDWFSTGDDTEGATKEVPSGESRSGNDETHHINTSGGSREDHSHVIVQHREGRDTAHCVPNKSKR